MNYLAWTHINDPMVKACTTMHALKLPGWRDSQGMAHEISLGRRWGKPIVWIEYRGGEWVRPGQSAWEMA